MPDIDKADIDTAEGIGDWPAIERQPLGANLSGRPVGSLRIKSV